MRISNSVLVVWSENAIVFNGITFDYPFLFFNIYC